MNLFLIRNEHIFKPQDNLFSFMLQTTAPFDVHHQLLIRAVLDLQLI